MDDRVDTVPYEILEHTADIGIRAFGRSLSDLFRNAALGVQSIAVDAAAAESRNTYEIAATGEDVESLLVNWLNEIIYYLDGKRVVFARLEVDELGEVSVSANASGEPRDPSRHPPRLVVKAATYHQLKIARTADQFIADVFLDI